MPTRTISNTGGNWNTIGAWVEAQVPTNADDVVATGTSGSLTINAAAACRSIDLTGYVGTLIQVSAMTLSVGDGSGGALKFVAGMGFTRNTGATIAFVSTSTNGGTGWSVDFGGKQPGPVTFSGAAGKWVLASAIDCGTTTFTHSAGTLDTGSFALTAGVFGLGGAGVRTFAPGSSVITASNSSPFTVSGSNSTWSSNTATLVTTSTAGCSPVFGSYSLGGASYSHTVAGNVFITAAGCTFQDFTRTGTASAVQTTTVSGSFTVAGTFSVNGNSLINRMLFSSASAGVPAAITCNGTATGSYVDFKDITGAGSSGWNLSAITGGAGDISGNSGITFTTPATQYWVGHTGTWGVAASWGTTSGGSGGRPPLPQDSAVFDANSFNAGGQTVTMSNRRLCQSIDASAATNNAVLNTNTSGTNTHYGSLIIGSNATFSSSGGDTITIDKSGSYTVSGNTTSVNLTLGLGGTVTLSGTAFTGTITIQGAVVTLGGALTSTSTLTLSTGSLTTANFNMSFSTFTFSSGTTLTLGTSTLTSTALSGTVYNFGNVTLSALTSTMIVSGQSVQLTRTFNGNNLAFGTLQYTVADSLGSITITGSNSFTAWNIGPQKLILFSSGTSQLVGTVVLNASNLGYIYVNGQYFVTPDHADFHITGDLDLIAKVRMDDWTPGAVQHLIAKDVASNLGFRFTLVTTGALRLSLSTNGTAFVDNTSSTTLAAAIGITDGTDKWVRVTRRQSDGRIQFFYGNDGSTWTQLGTDITGTTSALFNGTSTVVFGATNAGGSFVTGRLYNAIVKNGIAGTVVGNFDSSIWLPPATTVVDSASKTWTYTTIQSNAVGDGRIKIGTTSSPGFFATYLLDPPTVGATPPVGQIQWQQQNWADTTYNGYITTSTSQTLFAEHQSSFAITGDIDISAFIRATDWTPASRQYIASKGTTTSDISWRFSIETTGKLQFVYTSDGSTQRTATSSVATSVTDATDKWVRVTYASGSGAVNFYLSDDGGAWTLLGTTQTITAGAIFSASTRLRVSRGDNTTTGSLLGRIYQFRLKDGIDGTMVANPDYGHRTPQVFNYLEIAGNNGVGGGYWVAENGLDDGSNAGWAFHETIIAPWLDASATIYQPTVSLGAPIINLVSLSVPVTIFTPSVIGPVTVPLLDASVTVFQPSVQLAVSISVPFVLISTSVFIPSISQVAPVVFVPNPVDAGPVNPRASAPARIAASVKGDPRGLRVDNRSEVNKEH